jgi:hypothetical protein
MKTILFIIIVTLFACIGITHKEQTEYSPPIQITQSQWDSIFNEAIHIPRDSVKGLFGMTYHMSHDSVWSRIQDYFNDYKIICEKGVVKVYDYDYNKYKMNISMRYNFNNQNQLLQQVIILQPDTINQSIDINDYNRSIESFLIEQFGEKRYIINSNKDNIKWFDGKRDVSFSKYTFNSNIVLLGVTFQWGGIENRWDHDLECRGNW